MPRLLAVSVASAGAVFMMMVHVVMMLSFFMAVAGTVTVMVVVSVVFPVAVTSAGVFAGDECSCCIRSRCCVHAARDTANDSDSVLLEMCQCPLADSSGKYCGDSCPGKKPGKRSRFMARVLHIFQPDCGAVLYLKYCVTLTVTEVRGDTAAVLGDGNLLSAGDICRCHIVHICA